MCRVHFPRCLQLIEKPKHLSHYRESLSVFRGGEYEPSHIDRIFTPRRRRLFMATTAARSRLPGFPVGGGAAVTANVGSSFARIAFSVWMRGAGG
jgi:hypothetical protein